MKKLTLTIIAATMITFGVQGQGLVQFNNSVGSTSKISVNTTYGGAATGQFAAGNAGNFYFALFYSLTATAVNGSASAFYPGSAGAGSGNWVSSLVWNDSNWSFAGNGSTYNVNGAVFTSNGYAVSTASAGRVLGLLGPGAPDAVGGLAAGASAQFVVVGWSSNMGTTYGDVENWLEAPSGIGPFYIGESAVSVSTVVGDNSLNSAPTILAATVVPAFTMGIVVPEPSTLALVGLGGLSLLLFRRRK